MYTMSQNLKQINEYVESRSKIPEVAKENVIPLLCNADSYCKYNVRNVVKGR